MNKVYDVYIGLTKLKPIDGQMPPWGLYNPEVGSANPCRLQIDFGVEGKDIEFKNSNTITNLSKQQLDTILSDKDLFNKLNVIHVQMSDGLYSVKIGD